MAPGTTYQLTVNTRDEASEIFVIDSQFLRVGNTAGRAASFTLPEGLYTVKIRAGSVYSEQSVALFENKTVNFDPVTFSSAAPLEGTAKTHEYHIENAKNHSHALNVQLGGGSQIYIFARDFTGRGPKPTRAAQSNPMRGLALYNRHGDLLVDLETASTISTDTDPWAACNIAIDPGAYRLRLSTDSGDLLEQTLIASPGWQLQVFLLQKNYGLHKPDYRADISNASIFMTTLGKGFDTGNLPPMDPEETDARLVELARQAIRDGRNSLSGTVIQSLLNAKFANPMLGVYGAHLSLMNKEINRTTMEMVVGNLRYLLQAPHPDVEAIAIRSGLGSDYIFDMPPMLRRSWEFMLEQSVVKPEIIPESSFASQVAGNLWSEGLWMVWGESPNKKNHEELLMRRLESLQKEDDSGDVQPKIDADIIADRGSKEVFAMPWTTEEENDPDKQARYRDDAQRLSELVRSMGVPRARLESMMKTIDPGSTIY